MRKLLCPQCKIAGLYVKNEKKERLLVYVSDEGEVVPKNLEENIMRDSRHKRRMLL